MSDVQQPETPSTMALTTQIVAAYVAGNQLPMTELPSLIRNVYSTLTAQAGSDVASSEPPRKPAVSVKASLGDDFIICLEDGVKLKMLKRYLRSKYGMSPEGYRAKWNLPPTYPMVAPAYARKRSEFAKSIGLGRVPAGAKRPRKPKK